MPIDCSSIASNEPFIDCGVPFESANFFALDVETANENFSSICQIAVVRFELGRAVDVWHSFVNPGEPFSAFNVAIHRIDESTVRCAPDPTEVMRAVSAKITGQVVASHMPFDRIALQCAFSKNQLPFVECSWLDTALIARRAWPRFARRGYGLKSLAAWCGIEFRHHDAAEDALTAGRILSKAIADTGKGVEHWLHGSTVRKANSARAQNRHLQLVARERSPSSYLGSDVRQLLTPRSFSEGGA